MSSLQGFFSAPIGFCFLNAAKPDIGHLKKNQQSILNVEADVYGKTNDLELVGRTTSK